MLSRSLIFIHKLCPTSALLSPRFASTTYQHVDVVSTNEGYSILQMKKMPVNSMSLESMQEFTQALDEIEKSGTRGVIIASTTKAFCAGLDLLELVQPEEERLNAFWISFRELHFRLYSSPLVTIAAISGAAIAGGCAMSLCCDYRLMADGRGKIGLNTVHTGLIAPYWVDKLYQKAIGPRQAEKLLSLGHLSAPQEALKRGIVDKVVDSSELMNTASKEMKKWLAIPDVGRQKTKSLLRREFLEEFHALCEEDVGIFTEIVFSDNFQNHILKYVNQLKKK